MRKVISEFDRFISKVKKTDYCWVWTGSTYRFGYGHFRRKVKEKWVMYKAHRFSYETFIGPIPKGAFVCHKCDNPSCVNPQHLFTGTAGDNSSDMFLKGRRSRLIRNPRHKLLSYEIACEIRKLKKETPNIKLKHLAEKFQTSPAQISRILSNKIWQEEL